MEDTQATRRQCRGMVWYGTPALAGILCLVLSPAVAQQRLLTHEDWSAERQQRGLQRQHIWQTLDNTRPAIQHMKEIVADNFQVPPESRKFTKIAALISTPPPPEPVDVPGEKVARCSLTLGTWCKDWWTQTPVAWKPAPRGDKECPGNCNNVGVCNHATGLCACQAGWGGDNCSVIIKRPCSHRYRNENDPYGIPVHNLGPDKHDKDWRVPGWTAARCAGFCDDRLGLCFCGLNSTYRHIPAPDGSPLGTPPIQMGRPLTNPCQPSTDFHGNKLDWGRAPLQDLYGPNGWCNRPPGQPGPMCGCALETLGGPYCEAKAAAVCVNQCNLRGECLDGFCLCDPGWYGLSCDLKKKGLPIEPVHPRRLTPAIKQAWRDSRAARDPPERADRKRPLIYIYDLPTDYNQRVLQYRLGGQCQVRKIHGEHASAQDEATYGVEAYFHETLAASSHRTFDPEEADFFWLPVYIACYMWPVHGWTDGPWYHAPVPNPRPMHASNMMLEVKRWIEEHFPYWKRRGGKDHIVLASHDEGACYLPKELTASAIVLTHWGRMDLNHTCGSGWPPDNYSHPIIYKRYQDKDWRLNWAGSPCYVPGKDLVIPPFRILRHIKASPLMGNVPVDRDVLCFFRGDMGLWREWWYSRGIRQSLFRLAHEDNWRRKYNILLGMRNHYFGDYSVFLIRSKFCLVLPGDGWSGRMEDAVLHGCIPVIIQDNVHLAYESVLDYSKFSLRVPQAAMAQLPQILLAVNDTQLIAMQRELTKVWHRFAYTTGPLNRLALRQLLQLVKPDHDMFVGSLPKGHPQQPVLRYPLRNDAFHTVMQWLYGRIPDTRQPRVARHKLQTHPHAHACKAPPAPRTAGMRKLWSCTDVKLQRARLSSVDGCIHQ